MESIEAIKSLESALATAEALVISHEGHIETLTTILRDIMSYGPGELTPPTIWDAGRKVLGEI